VSKSVAVDGQVTATVGTVLLSPATTGTWTAGPITYQSYDKLKIGGAKVIHKAECTFSFSGSNTTPPTPVAVTGTEKVKLEPTFTLLQKNRSKVLLNGNSEQSSHGNTLTVVSENVLKHS
jgi:hypothetical protein